MAPEPTVLNVCVPAGLLHMVADTMKPQVVEVVNKVLDVPQNAPLRYPDTFPPMYPLGTLLAAPEQPAVFVLVCMSTRLLATSTMPARRQ
jgi:hypothetical protein